LDYDEARNEKVQQFIFSNNKSVFHLSDRSALANVKFESVVEDRIKIRNQLVKYSVQKLREGFSLDGKHHARRQNIFKVLKK